MSIVNVHLTSTLYQMGASKHIIKTATQSEAWVTAANHLYNHHSSNSLDSDRTRLLTAHFHCLPNLKQYDVGIQFGAKQLGCSRTRGYLITCPALPTAADDLHSAVVRVPVIGDFGSPELPTQTDCAKIAAG